MSGLKFFRRTSQRGCWDLASYHDPRSLTWSWGLSFRLFSGDERRVWPLVMIHPPGGQGRWTVRIPFVGMLAWATQKKMIRERTTDDALAARAKAESAAQ